MSTIPYPSVKNTPWFILILQAALLGSVLFAGLLVAAGVAFELYYAGRVYPGVSVGGIDLSGLSPEEAAVRIQLQVSYPTSGQIVLMDQAHVWYATPSDLGYLVDPATNAAQALSVGRRGGLFQSLSEQVQSWNKGINLPPTMLYDERIALQYLQIIASQVDRPVIEANLGLNGVEVEVHSGEIGRSLDIPATLTLVSAQLHTMQDGIVPLIIQESAPMVMDATAQADQARKILSAPLVLKLPDGSAEKGPWAFDQATLVKMLTISRVQSPAGVQYQVTVSADMLRDFLIELAPSLVRQPQNARYVFNDDSHKLEVIQEAVIGRALDVDSSIARINEKLAAGEHEVELVVPTTTPTASNFATGEDLGIRELVHAETTYFYGSSAPRIQNIKAAASRFHGLLIAPGETLSMAQVIGDISLDNGYAEALIILGNQTIKGVGGGVCQVSTTLFRAAFFAGYPIIERHAHAYRVGYYEQKSNGKSNPQLAGLDATVFVPLVDFKFKNDTPYWILMETYVEGYSLTWKFYSTKDDRTVDWSTTGPTNVTPAPDPLYRENSALSKGEIKQVDWAAEGAQITVTRTVKRDGNVLFEDRFHTDYEPWQAVYEYGPGTQDIPTPAATPH